MQYNRVNWQNGSSGDTPIVQTNLNIMDKGIDDLFNFIASLQSVPSSMQALIVIFSSKFNQENNFYFVQSSPIYTFYDLSDYQVNCTTGRVYTPTGFVNLTSEQLATISIEKTGNYFNFVCDDNTVCTLLEYNAAYFEFTFVETNS
jgi:hypothetical protein